MASYITVLKGVCPKTIVSYFVIQDYLYCVAVCILNITPTQKAILKYQFSFIIRKVNVKSVNVVIIIYYKHEHVCTCKEYTLHLFQESNHQQRNTTN